METEKERKPKTIIEIMDEGPLRINGNFVINDARRAREISEGEVFLCRCGKSKNKPFCDESHKRL
jgi:CDGSH iron-sulfur domain-containing protein 3